jgi:hypothetical protein
MATNPPRRMGPPGVGSGYFQRTIVGYTRLGHVTDIGLCPVLRTRPGFPPPQIRLPSTVWVRGIPVRRPALLPPASFRRTLLRHPCLRLPFASVKLGLDFVRQACQTTGQHHLAAGPRPGTQHPPGRRRAKKRARWSGGALAFYKYESASWIR